MTSRSVAQLCLLPLPAFIAPQEGIASLGARYSHFDTQIAVARLSRISESSRHIYMARHLGAVDELIMYLLGATRRCVPAACPPYLCHGTRENTKARRGITDLDATLAQSTTRSWSFAAYQQEPRRMQTGPVAPGNIDASCYMLQYPSALLCRGGVYESGTQDVLMLLSLDPSHRSL